MKRVTKSKVSTLEQRVRKNAVLLGANVVIYGDKGYRIGMAAGSGFIEGWKKGVKQTRR